ncbi:MAG: hypothetical protein WC977_01370 [Anaerovoracaceae bacterium]
MSDDLRKTVYARVYTGADPATLTLQADLYALRVSAVLSPGRSEAALEYEYGRISRGGGAFRTVAPLAIGGHYCRIAVTDGDSAEQTIFVGTLRDPSIQSTGTITLTDGTDVPTGITHYQAYGVEALLDQLFVRTSQTAAYGEIGDALAFNGRSAAREKNRSAAKSSGRYTFAWGSTAEYWSARDIIEYLLVEATDETDFTWSLVSGDCATALDLIHPQIDPAGKNIRDLLNECIRAQDGFAWRPVVDGATIALTLYSLVDAAVTVAGTTVVPANSATLSLSSATETDRLVQDVRISQVGEAAYSEIEVYSEPVRVTATLALTDLTARWSGAEETSFLAAGDTERSDDQYRQVYCGFRIPDAWDFTDFGGANLIPTVDPDTGTVDFTTPGAFAPPTHTFERTFPISETEQRPGLVLLIVDSAYVNASKTEREHPAVGLDLPDEGMDVLLKPQSNVLLAKNHFGSNTSEYTPYYDWQDGLVTISFYTDTRLTFRRTGTGTGGKRTIYVPGYHLWVTPNVNTLIDRDTTQASQYQRDDRVELRRIAAMLATWYGRIRNTIEYTREAIPTVGLRLGSIVTSAYSGGEYVPIATVVTSETFAWGARAEAYTLRTEFADLNLQALGRRRVEGEQRNISRRIRRVEEALQATPLRTVIGGTAASSSADIAPVQLTAKTNDTTYVGNVYANGRHNTATETGATIKVGAIAAGETLPTSGAYAWFVAHKEKWDVAGTDTELWTIQPEIFR